jgi:hypothetical protein
MKHQLGGSSMKNSDEGMGLSLAVYAIAMLCGLAVCVLPVVWANSGHVYENPGVTAANLPGGPARKDHGAAYPLASLQLQPIVSPAMLAELNAKSKKEKPVATRRASRPAHEQHYAQAQQSQDEPTERRPARRFGFFSFF